MENSLVSSGLVQKLIEFWAAVLSHMLNHALSIGFSNHLQVDFVILHSKVYLTWIENALFNCMWKQIF